MGFKLVRVGAVEPCKVSLPLGSHFIGRGKFLDCHDHRVSRKHAELIVTCDSILLKSLHQNPCFYKRSSSTDTIIFSQPDSQVLYNGDQFGLIPDSHWYEVIQCLDDSLTIQQDVEDTEERIVNEDSCTEPYEQTENNMEKVIMNEDSQSLLSREISSAHSKDTEAGSKISTTEHPTMMDTSANQPVESNAQQHDTMDQQNDTMDKQNESTDQHNESTDQQNKSTNAPNSPTVDSTEQSNSNKDSDKVDQSSVKRQHSEEDTPCDIKKVKLEPETPDKADNTVCKEQTDRDGPATQTVKKEPGSPEDVRPGPSHDQGTSSNGVTNGAPPAAPPSPDKQSQPRERCWYGATCYRRNPQHKSTYSHPSDADWGGAGRAACAAGAACRRRDPRHYRDYLHPGDRPAPGPPGMQFVRRHGNNYYINASVVHFHDDHFELEDSDGDSVDFDYEF